MRDTVLNNSNRMGAHGKVTLEYISKDGKSKAITTDNYAFNGAWNTSLVIHNFLKNKGELLDLILTDYDGEVDKNIPIIPGNTVGFCTVGSGSSGIYRGAEIIGKREQSIAPNGAITDKRVYEFTSSQVPGEIKTVGYSRQWKSSAMGSEDNAVGICLPKKISPESNIYNDYGIYDSASMSGVALTSVGWNSTNITFNIRFLSVDVVSTNKSITVQMGVSINYITQNLLVKDLDTNVYYVLCDAFVYDEGVYKAIRYFFELSDDFSTASKTKELLLCTGTSSAYSNSEYTKHYMYPSISRNLANNGVKVGNRYYAFSTYSSSPDPILTKKGLVEGLFEEPHTEGKVQKDFLRVILPQILRGTDNTNFYASTNGTIMHLSDRKVAFKLSNSNLLCFYDLDDVVVPYGSLYHEKGIGSYSLRAMIIENAQNDDNNLTVTFRKSSKLDYDNYLQVTSGAFTWFRVPDDAPKREEGDGIRITYEMTFTPV